MSALHAAELRRALEESGNVACVVDDALQFVYCNPAWDKFALGNNEEADPSHSCSDSQISSELADALKPLGWRLAKEQSSPRCLCCRSKDMLYRSLPGLQSQQRRTSDCSHSKRIRERAYIYL